MEKIFELVDIEQVTPHSVVAGHEADTMLVEVLEHSKKERITKGGVILPDTVDKDDELYFLKGKVVKSSYRPIGKDEFVLYSSGHGLTFKLDHDPDTEYRIIQARDVFAELTESTLTESAETPTVTEEK